MVSGKHKSRSLRRVYKKTPGAKNVIHYVERKPGKAKCAKCKTELPGIPRLKPSKMKNSPKTVKTTNRTYGGYYCSKCARKALIEKTKEISL